jgi:hypothetical protein
VTLGTGANNDFGVTDGSTEFLSLEGDVARMTWLGDGSANSDFILNDGTVAILTVQSDLRSIDVVLGGGAGNDLTINDGTADIFKISSDLRDIAIILATGAGNDFRINDGTDNLIHVQGDDGSVTINLATSGGNDFAINDGTDNLMLVQADLKSVIFDLAGGAGGDFSVTDGSSNMLLIQTDDDTVDVVGHDGSAKGLMLAGTLMKATAQELINAADVSGRTEELTSSGAVTAGIQSTELNHTSTAIAATIANSNTHQGLYHVKATTEPAGGQDHTLTLTSGTFNGSNNVATFADINDALLVYFDSNGAGTIIENVGTVSLS